MGRQRNIAILVASLLMMIALVAFIANIRAFVIMSNMEMQQQSSLVLAPPHVTSIQKVRRDQDQESTVIKELTRTVKDMEQRSKEAAQELKQAKYDLAISEEKRVTLEKSRLQQTTTKNNDRPNNKEGDFVSPIVINDEAELRPLWVTVAHQPRSDLLGSFSLATIYLKAIAFRYGWALKILPYKGSVGEHQLQNLFKLGNKIDPGWGSGFQDASYRSEFDPMKLNYVVYEELGFFREQDYKPVNKSEWIAVNDLPVPGTGLQHVCEQNIVVRDGYTSCKIWLPPFKHKLYKSSLQDTIQLRDHIKSNGGADLFFSESVRSHMREAFLQKNNHRLVNVRHNIADEYHIAMHVRRGDILDPGRWLEQKVYATVGRRICTNHGAKDKLNITVHVFSSGKNKDGDWKELEAITDTCDNVQFHLDEQEFDSWAYMVVADALVLSKSSFSYIPALLSAGEVHFPQNFWHPKLSHWHTFASKTGEEM
eukprot:scaffold71067_cov51-Attheya_sp.AAC.3